jgi:hypothetical protein
MSSIQSILDTSLAQSTEDQSLVLSTPLTQRTRDLLDISDSEPEIDLESSQSSDSINSDSTTRDTRIQIKTALLFNIPYKDICATLNITRRQLIYTKTHSLTPRRRSDRLVKLRTPQKHILETWLLRSPSNRHVPYHAITRVLPELNADKYAIQTAMEDLGYTRRIAPRKGYSNDPRIMAKRLAFAHEAIQWSRERLQNTMFTDEVWAMGGTHTQSYITIKNDGSENIFSTTYAVQKRSKAPAWMFWGAIIQGQKGPARFWEKEWGTMTSEKYISYILNYIYPVF